MTNREESVSVLMRVLRSIRDAWLVVGAVAVLIVGLELAYRAQGAVRAALGGGRPPDELFDDKPAWMDAYLAEQARTYELKWKSYVYFRRAPFRGTFINVDSAGHRVTPQGRVTAPARDIFLFGGSTMFGTLQRDSGTIAAGIARRLRDDGIQDVVVTNFGETGYVLAQEFVELTLQLRAGARPAVVVFYDGINDVFSAVQNGTPGIPQNESNRARDFALGARLFKREHDIKSELSIAAGIAGLALGRMELLQRVRGSVRTSDAATPSDEQVADAYVSVARMVGVLAEAYGFHAVFAWQPNLHATNKPLTRAERALTQAIAGDPAQVRVREIHRGVPAMLDSAMQRVSGVTFLDLSRVFGQDSGQVFADRIGHTTERANETIVNAIAPTLLTLVRSKPRTRVCAGVRRDC